MANKNQKRLRKLLTSQAKLNNRGRRRTRSQRKLKNVGQA